LTEKHTKDCIARVRFKANDLERVAVVAKTSNQTVPVY
jgi:hypothetical protein